MDSLTFQAGQRQEFEDMWLYIVAALMIISYKNDKYDGMQSFHTRYTKIGEKKAKGGGEDKRGRLVTIWIWNYKLWGSIIKAKG